MARVRAKIFWVAALLLVVAVVAVAAQATSGMEAGSELVDDAGSQALTRGSGRFLLHSGYGNKRPTASCRYSLHVCTRQTRYGYKKFKKAGCCKNQCVDLMEDKSNCGKCGKKCKFGFACCSGQCKQIYGSDCRNCGGCGKNCRDGVKCTYGICGYNAKSHPGKGHPGKGDPGKKEKKETKHHA